MNQWLICLEFVAFFAPKEKHAYEAVSDRKFEDRLRIPRGLRNLRLGMPLRSDKNEIIEERIVICGVAKISHIVF